MTIFPTGSGKSKAGHTLIEVMVAVVILSTGIVFVLCAFDASISALAASRNSMRAGLLLKEKFAEIEGGALPLSSEGAFAGADADFAWRVDASPASQFENSALNEVVVTVRGKNNGSEYSLATYVRTGKPK